MGYRQTLVAHEDQAWQAMLETLNFVISIPHTVGMVFFMYVNQLSQ